jgi:hypothetical protein
VNFGNFSLQTIRRVVVMVAIAVSFLAGSANWGASADEPGSIGIVLVQLYDPGNEPTHLGPLAVMHVVENSPAARAGIQCSDFVTAVNGVPVAGREYSDILKSDIRGPVGGTVKLKISRFDGSESEIILIRAPFPAHTNQAGDPFTYSVPGSWRADPRYIFPLPWWQTIPYKGFEDIFFSPNFDDTSSPEYHSFLFFLWLDGTHMLNAEQLQSDTLAYFRGIATERGRNYKFTPDLSKVSATYKEDPAASQKFGGVAAKAFGGVLNIYDTHGKVITLNSEVLISNCGTSDHTVIFFGQSLEPRDGEMWKHIDALRDAFHCGR